VDEFARRPSTLPRVGVDLRCFSTEELAKSVGAEVESWLYQLGNILNLKRLTRVIVAYDYEETLAGIDRSASVSRPLTATKQRHSGRNRDDAGGASRGCASVPI